MGGTPGRPERRRRVHQGYVVAVLAGFIVSMPVGPVAAVTIRQTLAYGAIAGFAAAFGVALVDAAYAAAGVVGLHIGLALSGTRATIVHVIAGVVLLALAAYFFLKRSHEAEPQARASSAALPTLLSGFGATFALSIPNPGPAVVAAAVFSGIGAAAPPPGQYAAVALAALLGAMLWWCVVVLAIGRLPAPLARKAFVVVNILCALALAAAGVLSLVTAL
jgi:threonine/homoserine/homoserine lactone efflux protein